MQMLKAKVEMSSVIPEQADEKTLQELVAKIQDLAVLPHVVFKVLELTSGQSDTAGIEMERAIVVDPGFSSKVLMLANSASYGLPRKVTAIREAIMFLGYKGVRNIAMTVGVYDLFIGKTDKESMRRRTWWRQSIDSAIAARWIAKGLNRSNPDEAYTCGLLHLIGKSILERVGSGQYDQVETLMAENGLRDVEAELMVFGVDHVTAAVAAAQKWGLPPMLISGLRYRDVPSDPDSNGELEALTALGNLCGVVAREGWSHNPEALSITPLWACEVLNLDERKLVMVVDAALAEIAAAGRAQF